MELVTNIVNVKNRAVSAKPGMTQIDTRVLERLRQQNANLQRQVLAAQNKALESFANSGDKENVKLMETQLSDAKKTISELEKKVKELTNSLNESLSKVTKKEKKFGFDRFDRFDRSDRSREESKPETADPVQVNSGIKISVN